MIGAGGSGWEEWNETKIKCLKLHVLDRILPNTGEDAEDMSHLKMHSSIREQRMLLFNRLLCIHEWCFLRRHSRAGGSR